jgi:hypothetical protein
VTEYGKGGAATRRTSSGYEVMLGERVLATFGAKNGQNASDFASGFDLGRRDLLAEVERLSGLVAALERIEAMTANGGPVSPLTSIYEATKVAHDALAGLREVGEER